MKFWQRKFPWYCQHSQKKENKREVLLHCFLLVLLVWYMKVYLVFYIIKGTRHYNKTFVAMENKVDWQQNRVFHLEDSMLMYGIYNLDTLDQLIDTVHKMHNQTSQNERLFASKINYWHEWHLSKDAVDHYAINSLLFLTTTTEK